MKIIPSFLSGLLMVGGAPISAMAVELCQGYGPQTPRDISSPAGTNARVFTMASGNW